MFKLKEEMSVTLLLRLLQLNTSVFERTDIVKDIFSPILEGIQVDECDDLEQLKAVK